MIRRLWIVAWALSLVSLLVIAGAQARTKHKDAQARRNQIIAEVETGIYSEDRTRNVTIREIVRRWLESRAGEVKDGTLDGYQRAGNNIVGPLLVGTTQQRARVPTSVVFSFNPFHLDTPLTKIARTNSNERDSSRSTPKAATSRPARHNSLI